MHDQVILEESLLESSKPETFTKNRHQWKKLSIILLERTIGIIWTSVILKFYRLLIRSITITLSTINDRFSHLPQQLNFIYTFNNSSTNHDHHHHHHHHSANSLHCITLIVILLCFLFLYLATKTYLQVIDYLYSSPLAQIPATVINGKCLSI